MAKNDPEFLQILICQLGEYVELNTVLDKTLLVLGQPERGQPLRDLINRHPAVPC
jgi:hypothetical protein